MRGRGGHEAPWRFWAVPVVGPGQFPKMAGEKRRPGGVSSPAGELDRHHSLCSMLHQGSLNFLICKVGLEGVIVNALLGLHTWELLQ